MRWTSTDLYATQGQATKFCIKNQKMASMLSAAAALFARTNISQNYTILSPGVKVDVPGNAGLPSLPAGPPFRAGLWLVQPAQHRLNGKRVSVWTFEKRGPETDRVGAQAKEMVLEALKAEVRFAKRRVLSLFLLMAFVGFLLVFWSP